MPATNEAKRISLWALAAAGLLTLWGCEGSATQTTNGGLREGEMGGVLVDREGNPVADAKVQISTAVNIPQGVPGQPTDDPPEAISDRQGRY